MTGGKRSKVLTSLKNKAQDLKNRQKIIHKNSNDYKKLELFLISLSESSDQVKQYYDENAVNQMNKGDKSEIYRRIEEKISEIDEWITRFDEKIDNFFEEIYEKIPGYYFGIIGLLIYLSSTFIAVLAYLSVNPNYSIFTNWISDLGTGPNGSNIIFNTGWIISSGLILLFHVYQIQKLKEKIKRKYSIVLKLMAISNLAFTLGIFLVGVFPGDFTFIYHIIGATFYFLGGLSFFSLYGLVAIFNKKIPLIYAPIATFVSISYILFYLTAHFPEIFLRVGITITSMEWLTLFTEASMMLVILLHSLFENFLLKKFEKESEKIKNGGLNQSKFKYKLLNHLEKKYL